MTIEVPQTFNAPQQVNTSTGIDNNNQVIQTLSDGTFVIVYQVSGVVHFQQYDQFGNTIGTEGTLVTPNIGAAPGVEILAVENNQLVLAYRTASEGIQVQSYSIINGVGATTTDIAHDLTAPPLETGNRGLALSGSSLADVAVHATLTDSGGVRELVTFTELDTVTPQLNQISTNFGGSALQEATLLENGNRVVVLDTDGQGTSSDTELTIHIMAPDGSEVNTVLTNSGVNDTVAQPQITALVGGRFVVAMRTDDADTDLEYQVFEADGTPVMSVVRGAFNNGADEHNDPELVPLEDGGFLVIFDRDNDSGAMIVRRFDADGEPTAVDPNNPSSFSLVLTLDVGDSATNPVATLLDDGLVAISYIRGGEIQLAIIATEALDIVLTDADETIIATSENDIIDAAGGDDNINAGAGDDFISSSAGADTLDGGAGRDTLSFEDALEAVNADLDAGVGTAGEATGDVYSNFEVVIGSDFNDTLTIGSDQDVDGGIGDDVLTTTSTNATLVGGLGDDTLVVDLDGGFLSEAGAPALVLDGGDGIDTADFTTVGTSIIGDPLRIDLASGEMGTFASLSGGTIDGIENIIGSTEDDEILGDAVANRLDGNDGNDFISGRDGDDTLEGGDGNDRILGGDGDDSIFGNTEAEPDNSDSDNVLNGEAGDDFIRGASGNDTIDGGTGNDTAIGGDGRDSIDGGEGDDVLSGGFGTDTINGGDGDDLIFATADGVVDTGHTDNILNGDAGNDTITGSDTSDISNGGTGNDSILGEGGDDTINGDDGNDIIEGGDGNDVLTGDDGDEFLVHLDNDDTIEGGSGNDSILGGNGEDHLFGDEGNDTIRGGEGDDLIEGGADNDALNGDSGADTIDGGVGDDDVSGGEGNDLITGGEGGDELFGDEGADTIFGGTGIDELNGGEGDDSLDGGEDNDQLDGGEGADSLIGGQGDDTLEGGDGNDSLDGGAGIDELRAGSGDDTLSGGAGEDSLSGGSGDDLISGGADNDGITGDSGNDTINGDDGDDFILGNSGRDVIDGGTGNDTLDGGSSSDTLTGGNGDDVVGGGSGNDLFIAGLGADTIVGGSGTDTVDYSASGASIDVTLEITSSYTVGGDFNTNTGGFAQGDFLFSIENVIGTDLNDQITGTVTDNLFEGGAGNDILDGAEGADTLQGGDGDDLLIGGTGSDELFGGNGSDTARFAGDRDTFIFALETDGRLSVTAANGDVDFLSDVEFLEFTDGTIAAAEAAAATDISLEIGVTETGDFGNKFNGQTDADGLITAGFESTGSDMVLTFQGFDIDLDNEVELFLNGASIGFLDAGVDNGLQSYSIDIAAADQVAGQNVITFSQDLNAIFAWGVTDILLEEADPATDISLEIGVTETGDFGNNFNGQTDADGLITAGFESTGSDMELTFQGFDIDLDNEVELFLNGASIGFLDAGVDNGLQSYSIDIAAADQVAGQNVITFSQDLNDIFAWGVTDLLIA